MTERKRMSIKKFRMSMVASNAHMAESGDLDRYSAITSATAAEDLVLEKFLNILKKRNWARARYTPSQIARYKKNCPVFEKKLPIAVYQE